MLRRANNDIHRREWSSSAQTRKNNGHHPPPQRIEQLASHSTDDDSLIRDLEETPTSTTTPNTQILPMTVLKSPPSPRTPVKNRSPFLSAEDELTLLAGKHKRNSPDRDEESAPSPPRSSHNRKVWRKPLTVSHSLLDDDGGPCFLSVDDITRHKQSSEKMPGKRGALTTYVDPSTGEAFLSTRPASKEVVPGLQSLSGSSSSSCSVMNHPQRQAGPNCSDSATTTTPLTLGNQLQGADGELRAYSTSYLPKLLDQAIISSGRHGEGIGSRPAPDLSISTSSNSYLKDLGLGGTSGASSFEEGPGDIETHESSTAGSSSYMLPHHLGGLMEGTGHEGGQPRSQEARRVEDEAEATIRAYTITPERKKLNYSSMWICIIVCLLVGAIAGVSVYWAKMSTSPKDGGMRVPPLNTNCQQAEPLWNFTGGTVNGEILLGVSERMYEECQVEPGDGYSLWYSVQGSNQQLSASTCVGTDMSQELDTQVLVFAGACGMLKCIGGSDQLCGSHGSVGWFAEQGIQYYIVVNGLGESNQGGFTLTLNTLLENGSCDEAKEIQSTETPVMGSTRNLTVDDSISSCDEMQVEAPASWFWIPGDGSVVCASVATEQSQKPVFYATISVLEGLGCLNLSCVDTATLKDDEPWITGDIAFVASEGASYYLAVRGAQDAAQGDFVLNIATTPSNGVCETAVPLQIGGGHTNGTLINACNGERSECQGLLYYPGVWYTVVGNGELLFVQAMGLTCSDDFGIQSQVSVFKGGVGGCSDLQCMEFAPVPCTPGNEKVISQWLSQLGEIYYVLVQSSDDIEFEVMIDELLPTGSDTCLNASSLVSSGESTFGSTFDSFPADLGECPNSGAEGVWYVVEGTGRSMEASTCHSATNYSTGLTIMTGGCDAPQCVPSKSVTCDGERSVAYWESLPGQQYSVYVHGQGATDKGRFSLTVNEGSLGVENDFCGTAEALTMSSTTYGSTVNASGDGDYAQMCGSVASAPGVWYTIMGEGSFISASLCGDSTSYDTQLYVFAGDTCTNMTCVDFNEDGCGVQSRVDWKAEENQLYYILVSGFGAAVGDFELVVK